MKYCVVALPRSRTAWLAAWLGVEHEPLSRVDSLDEAPEGVVDTASALFFPGLFRRWPDARYLFVFRDLAQIARSSVSAGLSVDALPMLRQAQDAAHRAVQGRENVAAVTFDELGDPAALERVWGHLRTDPFDAERTQRMAGQNIQAERLLGDFNALRARRLLRNARMNRDVL